MTDDNNEKKTIIYKTILEKAVQKRKGIISTRELAEKLSVAPTSLYRLERGEVDIRVSTFLSYLDGFGFTIEVVPYKSGRIQSKPETVPFDLVDEDLHVLAENNSDFNDRKQRLKLLKYLLLLEQQYLESEENNGQ